MNMPLYPSRDVIAECQLKQLNRVIAECLNYKSFYTARLQAKGLEKITSLKDCSSQLNLTTKKQIVFDQIKNPPYGTFQTLPLDQFIRFHQTSGTKDKPVIWLDSKASWEWMIQNWLDIFSIAGLDRTDKVMFAFSFGPFLGFWLAFEAAVRLGCLCISGGSLSTVERIQCMINNRIDVLCCTPTYAIYLAQTAKYNHINIKQLNIKKIILAGEPGAGIEGTRQVLENSFGQNTVFDHYGMTEVGPVSFECPSVPGRLHIIETSYYVEVIDSKTQLPVQPGDIGELILTPLGRVGCPILRYRTGDLVKLSGQNPCPCGRYHLGFDQGIIGRLDDMVSVRGINLYPSAVDSIIRKIPEISEYRVTLFKSHGLQQVSIEIEVLSQNSKAVALQLEKELHAAFFIRISIKVAKKDTLPRFTMKAKRWVSLP